jgi:hypothetical protein
MQYGILAGDGQVMIPFVAPTRITSNAPAFGADSISLKRYTLTQFAQRWEIRTNLYPEVDTCNFLTHSCQFGTATPFWIRMPQPVALEKFLKNAPTNLTTLSSSAAGSSSVTVGGTFSIPAGTFLRFGNADHSKVYMARNALTPTSRSLQLVPPLLSAVPLGTAVICRPDLVQMKCFYDTSTTQGISYVDGILSDPGQVTLIESI